MQPFQTAAGVDIRDLAASFTDPAATEAVPVFGNLELELPAGKITGIVGPNGCGKSTLLRTLVGLHPADHGAINGLRPVDWIKNAHVGYVPQDFRASFFLWCSVRKNIVMARERGRTVRDQRAATDRMALSEFVAHVDLDLRPHQCSGGMLQAAALLRALVGEPQVILADEPFSAMDVRKTGDARRALLHYVEERGASALLVLHDVDDVASICHNVVIVPGGPFTTTGSGHPIEVVRNRRPDTSGGDVGFVDAIKAVIGVQP